MNLAAVVARVESDDNPYALRFEPSVYTRAKQGNWGLAAAAVRTANRCSNDTAAMILATSWGRFQIMGFNLYSPIIGLAGSVVEFLGSSQEGQFAAFVKDGGFDAAADPRLWEDSKLREFAAFYNGPGAVAEYAARLKSAMETN